MDRLDQASFNLIGNLGVYLGADQDLAGASIFLDALGSIHTVTNSCIIQPAFGAYQTQNSFAKMYANAKTKMEFWGKLLVD